MSIGENIRKFREAKKISQQQLADRMGMTRPCISQFELGSRIPNLLVGDAIAKELECTLDDLLGRGSPPPSQSTVGDRG